MWTKGLVWVGFVLLAQSAWAQDNLKTQATKNWAWDKVKSWSFYRNDARGDRIWSSVKFLELSYEEQTQHLLERLKEGDEERRAALLVLADRPFEQWARNALRKADNRDEVALFLYQRGFKMPDKDPYVYMEPSSKVDRPWSHGLGLHLDSGGKWRMQWISSPILMPKSDAAEQLPAALKKAAQPGAMLHLKKLRPGLERLKKLSGEGDPGIVGTLIHGTRAGFLLNHLDPWLKQAAPVLEPLADREAWILHYGVQRDDLGPGSGTLIFITGELPLRAKLVMGFIGLNPLSKGARSRNVTWKDNAGRSAQVQQIRASGGMLSVATTPEGTWISDREAPLRAILFPLAQISLAERTEWCRTALAAMKADTEVSLWVAPRVGADAGFERAAIRRRILGSNQQTWPNPFVAKAAPRTGPLSVSFGAGPTELLVASMMRMDRSDPLQEPTRPSFAEGSNLSSSQEAQYQKALQEYRDRKEKRKGLRADMDALMNTLDLRGAALHWRGWVTPPPIQASEKAAAEEFRKLQNINRWQASQMQREGRAKIYGGYGEPGMTPSMAVALPVKEGKGAILEESLKKLWPKMFMGKAQTAKLGTVEVKGIQTVQAFAPCYAIVENTLVLGSDGEALQAVAQGLQGQAPTLADLQSSAYGRAELDGPAFSKQLEALLLTYMRVNQGGRFWWWGEPEPTGDEAAAELASSLGPFLGALKGLGKVNLEMNWGAGGLEITPK